VKLDNPWCHRYFELVRETSKKLHYKIETDNEVFNDNTH